MKFALFAVVLLAGLAGGGAAGMFLTPSPALDENETLSDQTPAGSSNAQAHEDKGDAAYVEFRDKFILPLIENGTVREHVVLSVALETKPEAEETLRAELTKIRAEIVVALYDFAAIDGFSPTYHSAESLSRLQRMIQDAVKRASNLPEVKALITDFVRQKA